MDISILVGFGVTPQERPEVEFLDNPRNGISKTVVLFKKFDVDFGEEGTGAGRHIDSYWVVKQYNVITVDEVETDVLINKFEVQGSANDKTLVNYEGSPIYVNGVLVDDTYNGTDPLLSEIDYLLTILTQAIVLADLASAYAATMYASAKFDKPANI